MTPTPFKPYEACFWIVGLDNLRQAAAVVVDIHDAAAEHSEALRRDFPLVRSKSAPSLHRQARKLAQEYAKTHGIPATRVTFDADTTEYYAED